MTISVAVGAPVNGPLAVAREVSAIYGRALGFGHERSISELGATNAHRAYECSLLGAAENVMALATFSGWRYLILHGSQPLLEAELDSKGGGRLISATVSPGLGGELADLEWLAAQDETAQRDFELCHLRVPAGVLRAWWLRNLPIEEGNEADLIMPVLPSAPALRGDARRLWRPAEFRAAVAPLAEARLTFGAGLLRG